MPTCVPAPTARDCGWRPRASCATSPGITAIRTRYQPSTDSPKPRTRPLDILSPKPYNVTINLTRRPTERTNTLGLDMHLYRKVYAGYNVTISVAECQNGEYTSVDATPDQLLTSPHVYTGKHHCVLVPVAYWRKANQIHDWFVRNVQGGEDACNPYAFGADKLAELNSACIAVAANPKRAPELLPTVSGFFFGGTDYDESYWQDIRDTLTQLDWILDTDQEDQYVYESSW